MKVGMIGLGRMGEGMSRRLIAAGHEVHGFRNNYEKACKQFEEGYISGCTTSVESLVQVVHTNKTTGETPGVFMMVNHHEDSRSFTSGFVCMYYLNKAFHRSGTSTDITLFKLFTSFFIVVSKSVYFVTCSNETTGHALSHSA